MMEGLRSSLVVGLIQVATGWGGQIALRDFPPVSEGDVQSGQYEIQQIMGGSGESSQLHAEGGRIALYFDPYSQTMIATTDIRMPAEESSERQSGIKAVRVDGDGNRVDSLDWWGRPWGDSGVVFEEEAYMDWLRTGDASRKPYADVLNQQGELSAQAWARQFRQLHDQADEVYFQIAPGEWGAQARGAGYFRLASGWVLLYGRPDDPDTRLGFNPGSEPIMAGFPDHSQKEPFRIRALEGALRPFHDWSDPAPENRLSIVEFQRDSYRRSAMLTLDSPRLDSGFHGQAAFRLHHDGHVLQFSAYAYEVKTLSNGGAMNGYNPDLTFYELPPEVPGSDHLLLINLFNGALARRPTEETGLFAVRLRQPTIEQ